VSREVSRFEQLPSGRGENGTTFGTQLGLETSGTFGAWWSKERVRGLILLRQAAHSVVEDNAVLRQAR